MRVLHLSTFDIRGGAARGTYWLHQALARRDVDSRMLVGRKYSGDPTVTEPPHRFHRIASAVRGRLDSLPLSSYRKTDESYRSGERSVGEEWVSACRSLGSPDH